MSSTPPLSISSTWTIAPVTLAEYANALYEVLEIMNSPSFLHSDPNVVPEHEEIFVIAHRLSFLSQKFRDQIQWNLLESDQIKENCQTVQDILDPIERLYFAGIASPSQMLTVIRDQLTPPALRSALVSCLGELSPLQEGSLDISPEEVIFIETFRKFNNQSDKLLSEIGEVLSASSDFLEGLNLLNTACTWNPGQKYISPESTLIDPSSADAWYPLFIAQVNGAQINGIRLLRNIRASAVYPETSNESSYLNKILDKIDAPASENGFENLYNQALIKKMWEDQSFQIDIRTAIELSLNINEKAQHDVNKILFQSKVIADATSSLFENQNQSLTNIAKRINR